MSTPTTYDDLERPYNNLLERDIQDISDVSSKTPGAGVQSSNNLDVVGGGGGGENGSVESMSVKSDGGMGDVWIKNFIRSENWKPKTVGFYINGKTGYAEFTDVYVSGEIEALSGLIGGFTIGDTDLSVTAGGNTTILSSGSTAFSAGPTGAPTVTITQAGILTASGVNITGEITATSGTIGGCTINADSISSTTFVSGPLGSGWNINKNGTAEFQNVIVRGIIKTAVFEKDTISAVNGVVLVSKADVLGGDMTASDISTLTVTGETTFVANELIRMKDGTNDEWMLVTDASGAPTYIVTRDLSNNYPVNTNPIWKKGTAVVSMGVGTGNKTGYVLIDSSSTSSPFIDVYGRNSNTYTDVTLHGRFGWLKGIVDADVGLNYTDVWGLYTDNAYIKGTVVATSGTIGGWTVGEYSLIAGSGSATVGLDTTVTVGDDIRIYAGSATPASAPFSVTEAGNTRVNVLTNKSILFETVSSPSAVDGQIWCANNAADQKVLWGYFGGNTTNKQQLSASRMFASGTKDNDNTGGGSTLTYDLEISTWFQPRSIDAKGFIVNTTGAVGVTYGFAQSGSDGVNTGFYIDTSTLTSVVSNIAYSDVTNLVAAANLTTTGPNSYVPAAIDGTGHVTSAYANTTTSLISGTSVEGRTVRSVTSWTDNTLTIIDSTRAWQQGDCILSSNYNATRTNLDAYAYVLSWTDTKVTIRIVCAVGYRMFCHFNVIG